VGFSDHFSGFDNVIGVVESLDGAPTEMSGKFHSLACNENKK
jgi:hypothetical protein